MSNHAIAAISLGKRFRLGKKPRYVTLRDKLAEAAKTPFQIMRRLSRRPTPREDSFWALKDVSFEVPVGSVLGVVGGNGAGKSTLLKVLSRITSPSHGEAEIQGRVSSLLEVGTGFHPELSGRENIYLNGAILGMKRATIVQNFDAIVDFAGVERFIDTPVKHYSSGMYMRLAFAVAAHLESEILLVDEVLAVGDVQFQKKCLGKMKDTVQSGRTILFVSHNVSAIRQLCTSALWLKNGMVASFGPTEDVLASYLAEVLAGAQTGSSHFAEDLTKPVQLSHAVVLDPENNPTFSLDCDHPVTLELAITVREPTPGLTAYLEVQRVDGTAVLVTDSFDDPPNPLDELAVGAHRVWITIPPRTLGTGEYVVYLNLNSTADLTHHLDTPGIICRFQLDDYRSQRGSRRGGFLSTLPSWRMSAQLRNA